MKKFKVLFGRKFQVLSVTETTDNIPEGSDSFYDLGSDMEMPDFLLVRARNQDEAYNQGLVFIRQWEQEHHKKRQA